MKKYIKPDFKAEKFEVEDVICLSNGGNHIEVDGDAMVFSAEGGMAVSELLK